MKKYKVLVDDLFYGFEKGDIVDCDEYKIDGNYLYKKYVYDDEGKIDGLLFLYGTLVENYPQWFKRVSNEKI